MINFNNRGELSWQTNLPADFLFSEAWLNWIGIKSSLWPSWAWLRDQTEVTRPKPVKKLIAPLIAGITLSYTVSSTDQAIPTRPVSHPA